MKTLQLKNNLAFTALLALSLSANISFVKAQQIAINERSHLVMNGNVSLVVNNAAIKNNGTFTAGTGEVKFSGSGDSSSSNVDGANSIVFYNLTVSKPANGVTLKSTTAVKNTLTVESGTLYTNNRLTLKSDETLTARVAPVSGNIIGKATVERYIPARRAWRMLTAPVSNSNTIFESWQNGGVYEAGVNTFVTGPNPSSANGLDASPQNNVSMKTWNTTTQSFTNITNTYVPVSAGNNGQADNTGYFIFVRGDRNINNFNITTCNSTTLKCNGNLQQGTQSFTVSPVAGAYTLVGNPYASPVSFNALSRNNVMNRFYVWDPALNTVGGYVMLDDLGNTGSYTKSVNASNQTKEIQSGQAFMVQTAGAGIASVVFDETNKSSVNNTGVFRPLTASSNTADLSQKLSIDLDIIQQDGRAITADGTFAEFKEGYSSGVDYFDALKFTNINECLALVRNNVALTAERRSPVEAPDTLFIKIWKTNAGYNYQFRFDASNFTGTGITLVDRYIGSRTDISTTGASVYSFTVDANAASSGAGRFIIILDPVKISPVTIGSIATLAGEKNTGVKWSAENEKNVIAYEVERSTDGHTFERVGSVTANESAKNNSSYNNYILTDVSPSNNASFYRIKAIESKGAVTYSRVVKSDMAKRSAPVAGIFPNPVTDSRFSLQLNFHANGVYKLTLTNNIGQVVYSTAKTLNGMLNTLQVSLPVRLASGVYQLEVVSPAGDKQVLQLMAE